jgi:hypothetical protein
VLISLTLGSYGVDSRPLRLACGGDVESEAPARMYRRGFCFTLEQTGEPGGAGPAAIYPMSSYGLTTILI